MPAVPVLPVGLECGVGARSKTRAAFPGVALVTLFILAGAAQAASAPS
jgi:predicted branched-subunit amino acid permease